MTLPNPYVRTRLGEGEARALHRASPSESRLRRCDPAWLAKHRAEWERAGAEADASVGVLDVEIYVRKRRPVRVARRAMA